MRTLHLLTCIYYYACGIALDQRNMGMSMRVEQSTLEQVKKRFEVVKKRKDEEKKKYGEFHRQPHFE